MVTSRAVVGSSAIISFGLEGERHRDHHALAHATTELVGEALEASLGLWDADQPEQLDRASACIVLGQVLVRLDRLDHLLLDRQDRIQARHRVLEDHRDIAAPDRPELVLSEGGQDLAIEGDGPAFDPAGRLRAGAGSWPGWSRSCRSPDSPTSPAAPLPELERDAVDGVDRALVGPEADHQPFDRQERRSGRYRRGNGHRRSLGSSDSRIPSPSRLNPIALMTIAAPGKKMSHGA